MPWQAVLRSIGVQLPNWLEGCSVAIHPQVKPTALTAQLARLTLVWGGTLAAADGADATISITSNDGGSCGTNGSAGRALISSSSSATIGSKLGGSDSEHVLPGRTSSAAVDMSVVDFLRYANTEPSWFATLLPK
jgi:hypothetical protein